MSRSSLEIRLAAAGLTAEQFADILGVDPKTVQRWVAGRTPHRRHRAAAARALDTPEHDLWPEQDAADTPRAGAGLGDVIASWATADDRDAPDLDDLVASAGGPIDVLDNANHLLRDELTVAALLEAASPTSPVRVLVDIPRRELLPLIGVEHLELRVADNLGSCTVIRAGDRMFVRFDLVAQVVFDPDQDTAPPDARPQLELSPATDNGLFARMADYFEDRYADADGPILSDQQLDEYLIDSPGIHEFTGDPSDDLFSSSSEEHPPIDPEQRPAPDPPEQAPAGPPARRWPRRHD